MSLLPRRSFLLRPILLGRLFLLTLSKSSNNANINTLISSRLIHRCNHQLSKHSFQHKLRNHPSFILPLTSSSLLSNLRNKKSQNMTTSNLSSTAAGAESTGSPFSNWKEDAQAYNTCISSAVDITQAHLHNDMLTLTRSSRDVDSNSRRKFLHSILLPNKNSKGSTIVPPMEIPSNVKARIPSPSGDKLAIFLESTSSSDDNASAKQTIVEIWTNQGQSLSNRIILPISKLHGPICTDTAWFGSFSWNIDETAIVYSAEMLPPTTKSFFDTSSSSSSSSSESEKVMIGGQYTLGLGKGEDWGEKYTTTCRLNLYCLQVETGKVGLIKNAPGFDSDDTTTTTTTKGGFVLGQAIFSPCGTHVVYTGWDAGGLSDMPKRLGSIYCYQRASKIYASPIGKLLDQLGRTDDEDNGDDDQGKDGSYYCITPNDKLAQSPRFSQTSSKLMYLCNTKGFDTHGGCMGLHTLDWDAVADQGMEGLNQTRKELVPPIQLLEGGAKISNGSTVSAMSFPGLFVGQLPSQRCTSPDGKYLFVTTQWGICMKIIRIDLESGQISPIYFTLERSDDDSSLYDNDASQTLLCLTKEGDAIVSQSTPGQPPIVGLLSSKILTAQDQKSEEEEKKDIAKASLLAHLSPITATAAFPSSLSHSSESIKHFRVTTSPDYGDVKMDLQGILLLPPDNNKSDAEKKKIPLIVVPHGGPHSCTPTSYIPSYAFLCHQGYAILHVNYRGSAGYGQASLESLAGSIGSLDVKDVVSLTQQTLKDHGNVIDANRVGICGGSHGGFLTGHLIGQHGDIYKVAAMRNPVTNIASMVTATDIPDWCYVEALGVGKYDWKKFSGPGKDDLVKMWEKSPIAHIENVKAPTLVALGMSDKRVPPSQGLEYYHDLRSRGIHTKLLVYEKDDHAIDRPVSEADHWVNIKQWFDTHL